MRRAVSAPFALLALTALTVGAYGAAEHAVIVGQEPNWNSEHWEQDKTYYSTWAHLHFCVDPSSSVRDLDSLRAVMLEKFQPIEGVGSFWNVAHDPNSTWVAPAEQSALVDDLVWPYSRERLTDAQELCVKGAEGDCCCKGRGRWIVYARFETPEEAVKLWEGLREPVSWDADVCIGTADGGVREETAIAGGHLVRVAMQVPSTSHRQADDERTSKRNHVVAFSIGFAGVFVVAIWLTCVFATTKAMWTRFVWQPLERYYETRQLIRIETAVTQRAARLRDDLQAMYDRAVYGHGRDALDDTDQSIEMDQQELQLLDTQNPIMSSPVGNAYVRYSQNSPCAT